MFFPSKTDTDLTAVTLFIRPTQNFLLTLLVKRSNKGLSHQILFVILMLIVSDAAVYFSPPRTYKD